MKKQFSLFIALFFTIILISSFTENGNHTPKLLNIDTTLTVHPLIDKVLTKEQQQAYTPDMVIQSLKDGSIRFLSNSLTARDHSMMVRDAALGQYPKAVVLSCMDSRVPVEDIFDKGIGDLFILRVAGIAINKDILGSMEYGCKVSGSKLILVLGHKSCGAIKAAIEDFKLGNITTLLSKIKPSVENSKDFKGKKHYKNTEYVDYVAIKNIKNAIKSIRIQSPILNKMELEGKIKIVGAIYNLHTGEVEFL